MSDISISINGRIYDIACDEGQEERLADIASYVEHRLQKIARNGGVYSEAHLLVLTTLVLADEILDCKEAIHDMQQQQKQAARNAAGSAPAAQQAPTEQGGLSKADEDAMARLIQQMAGRIEGIAEKLKAA